MKMFSGEKRKKGFTTTEVILVVAILIIAMAIAVPGIVRLSRNLKIAKLDSIAREIYTSAQSRAVSLSVSGQLSQVVGADAKLVNAGVPVSEGIPESSTPPIKCVYKSGSGSSDDLDMILPLGGIDENVRQNYFIIEYNPVTAMINGVYYWEKDDNTFYTDSAKGYGTLNPNDKDARMRYSGGMVGYYGGEDVEGRLDYASEVTAKLVNDEVLYLEIMKGFKESAALDGTITIILTDLDKDESKEISFSNKISNNANIPNEYKDILTYHDHKVDMAGNPVKEEGNVNPTYAPNFRLTLDSLNAGQRFSKLFPEESDGAFHPGCNLKITVNFQENGKKMMEESFLTNSLFASMKGSTAYVACGRHLENLGVLWVYQNYSDKVNGGTLKLVYLNDDLCGVETAVQTNNIDWHESLKKVGIPNPTDPTTKVSFKPIVNNNLQEFDGGGNTISHMDMFGSAKDELLKGYPNSSDYGIGLFSRFEGKKLENVNLVDCTVKDLTGNNLHVGLLAGMLNLNSTGGTGACKVTDCHAYATVTVDKDNNKATVNACSIEGLESTDIAGGLFGSIENAKGMEMEQCSASLTSIAGKDDDTKAKYVGGLAGSVDCTQSVTISSCYADTGVNLEGSEWISGMAGSTVGGLLGNIAGSGAFTLDSCYAVGNVSSGNACGLVGPESVSGTRTLNNCYAALIMEGNNIVSDLVPEDFQTAANTGGCINYSGIYDDFESLGEAYVKANANTTKPYGMYTFDEHSVEKVNTAVYPFPRLKNMPHYGDWPQEGNGVEMAYFELYEVNGKSGNEKYKIGFYNKTLEENISHPLQDDEMYTIVMDGYAVMFPVKDGMYGSIDMSKALQTNAQGKSTLSIKYNDKNVDTSILKLMDAKEKLPGVWGQTEITNKKGIEIEISKDNKQFYYPLFLSSAMMVEGGDDHPSSKTNYYQKLEVLKDGSEAAVVAEAVGGEDANKPIISVYFNPYVAKSEFVNAKAQQTGSESENKFNPQNAPEKSIMRTSRQITAYSCKAMQSTAIKYIDENNKTNAHTLLLERNIDLNSNDAKIKTDSSINGGITPVNLSIPNNGEVNVILELNGKILTGKEGSRVVSCPELTQDSSKGATLEVYGYTVKDKEGNEYKSKVPIPRGTIKGGGISMANGAEGLLNNVTINYLGTDADAEDKSSVNMGKNVTLEGCTIIDESSTSSTPSENTTP